MTAARTSFNADAWNGTRPLVAPMPSTIEVGCVVWEKTPDQAERERETGDAGDSSDTMLDARRGGIVARVAVDQETGEKNVVVLRARKRQSRFEVYTTDFNSSDLDGSTIEPRTQRRMHRAARQIFRALGESQGALVDGYDRYLVELAVGFIVLAEEEIAERTAARDQRQADKRGEVEAWAE